MGRPIKNKTVFISKAVTDVTKDTCIAHYIKTVSIIAERWILKAAILYTQICENGSLKSMGSRLEQHWTAIYN